MQTTSAGGHHVDRLHHHRARVHAATRAIDDAIHATVTAHYADEAGPGSEQPLAPPDPQVATQPRARSN